MRKRNAFLSAILIICMLFTTVSVDVFAEGDETETEAESEEDADAAPIASPEAEEEPAAEEEDPEEEAALPEETRDREDQETAGSDAAQEEEAQEEDPDELPPMEDDPMAFQRPNLESALEDNYGISAYSLKSTGKITAYGIDVSYYDGTIDWKKVAADGVDFAIIRIGYRGYGNGKLVTDTQAINNLKGAQEAGVKIGAYFYSTALNETEAKEEAKYMVNIIKDYKISYPVAYDCEGYYNSSSRDYGLSVSQRTKNAIAFLDYVQTQGYTGMMYASKSSFENDANWNTTKLEDRYAIWVAQYPYQSGTNCYTSYKSAIADSKSTSYTGAYRIWQFTSSGKVNGINHVVDLDFDYSTTGSVSTTVTNSNAVSGLASSSVSTSSISLSWSKLSGVDGYQVKRKASGEDSYETVKNTTSTSYKDSSLKAGTTYSYKVRGYTTDSSGNKTYSDYSSVLKVATKPKAPSSFKGSASAFDTIKLSWGKVSGASGYQIQRYKSSSKSYETVKTVSSGSTTSYSNGSLNSSTNYKYRIRAYITVSGTKTYSAWSDVITVKTKSSVKGTVTGNNVNLRSGAGTSYKSYKKVSKGKSLTITGSNGSWYKTSTTVNGKSKTCYIKNSYVKLNSSSSTSKPGKTTLKKSKATFSTIKLSWSKVSGASGYQIQRYNSSKKKYETVTTIKKGSTTSYTNKNLNSATTYKYRIRAYKSSNGKKTYGSWSSTLSAKTGKSVSGKTTGKRVNVRKGAGKSYSVITNLSKKGTKVTVTGERSKWYRVSVTVKGKKKTGYISKDYLKLT